MFMITNALTNTIKLNCKVLPGNLTQLEEEMVTKLRLFCDCRGEVGKCTEGLK